MKDVHRKYTRAHTHDRLAALQLTYAVAIVCAVQLSEMMVVRGIKRKHTMMSGRGRDQVCVLELRRMCNTLFPKIK